MIKLLAILLTFMTLYGGEIVFNLPDHHTMFLHHLSQEIKNSSKIVVISSSFNHSKLKKEFLKRTKKGSTLMLIVHDPKGDPLSMVQYDKVNLYLSPSYLVTNIILIDRKAVCTFNVPLNEENFSSVRTLIRCNDTPDKIKTALDMASSILRHSQSYLE